MTRDVAGSESVKRMERLSSGRAPFYTREEGSRGIDLSDLSRRKLRLRQEKADLLHQIVRGSGGVRIKKLEECF